MTALEWVAAGIGIYFGAVAALICALWLWAQWLRRHPMRARPLLYVVPTVPPGRPKYRLAHQQDAPATRQRPGA